MLKSESDNPEAKEGMSETERIRVRPEELAHAIAVIEARHQQEARVRDAEAGTIPLGEAVTDLMLDATPEELWAEIQKQRQAVQELVNKEQYTPDVVKLRPKKSMMFEWTLMIGFLFIAATLLITNVNIESVDQSPATQSSDTLAINGAPSASDSPSSKTPGLRVTVRTPQGAVIRTLDEIADDVPVRCTFSTISSAYPQNMRLRYLSIAGGPGPSWTLIKHNGKPYLRGWMQVAMSRQAMTNSTLVMFNSPKAPGIGQSPAPVTLALDTLTCNSTDSHNGRRAWERILVSDAQPDNYAWKKP